MKVCLQAMMEDSLARQGRRLFCWFPVVLGAGSTFYFVLKAEPGFWMLFVFSLFAIAGIGLYLIASPGMSCPLIMRVAGAGGTVFSAGFLLAYGEAHLQPPFPALPYQAVWIRGGLVQSELLPPRPVDHPSVNRHPSVERWRVTLKKVVFETPWDERLSPLQRTLRVTLKPGDVPEVESGENVKVRVILKKTPPPSYPGAVDFQREAWFSGRAGGGRAFSALIHVAEPGPHNGLFSRWTTLREHIARHIGKVLSGQDGAFAATVLCGETSTLSSQTRQDFAASGLAHLLAVAGLHLGLVMTFCAFTLRALLVTSPYLALYWPCRTIAYVSALVIGAFYVALTGFHLPGLRALGMACLVILAMLTGRQALSLRSLALVALALEVTKPSRILDVSFQMSFMAVMALIVGYEVLRTPLSDLRQRSWMWGKVGLPLIFLALTSLLAGSAVLPVSMAHFGAFQPWFVVANMAAVPVMGFWIMPLGLVSLLFMPFGLETIPLHMMGWGIGLVRWSASFMAHAPLASLPVPALPSWGLVLILTGLSIFCLWKGKARFAGTVLLCVGMASPWLQEKPVMLISSDGTELAFRAHHHLYVSSHGRQDFILRSWQKDFALPVSTLPENCRDHFCLLSSRGRVIMWMAPSGKEEKTFPEEAFSCPRLALIVNFSRRAVPCPGVMTIDRQSLRQEGSWAVYHSSRGGLRLLSDRQQRGYRLWVMEPGQEGDPGLPLAPSE
ncbi:ComEC/Rec2 family competence protein [Acetobacteraceae bacterium ESL0709]|nr:ComEC/Rec2 family competence protein [Acetobacteraceae bacterium ESL0697]MDF7677472.1 ComEC/Rec2 family competence protein [Acetobacteraceae bacterium ESL0709]